MSFKREGNDGSQLNLLKKRRVAELLANDIPDDEALLMSSGRYACTVCHYRPVFDTLDMLTVHRAGKKHHHAIEHQLKKQRELALLLQKRRQEAELMSEPLVCRNQVDNKPAPLLQRVEEAKKRVLLKESPYNPCHTYRNDGPSTQRKGKLFFQNVRQLQLRQKRPQSVAPKETHLNLCVEQVSGNNRPDRHSRTPAQVVSTQTSDPGVSTFRVKPYVPKSRRLKSAVDTGISGATSPTATEERQGIQVGSCKEKCNSGSVMEDFKSAESGPLSSPAGGAREKCHIVYSRWRFPSGERCSGSGKHAAAMNSPVSREMAGCDYPCKPLKRGLTPHGRESVRAGKRKDKKGRRKGERKDGEIPRIGEERRKELQRHLQLTSSGWVQDPGGGWIKGDDVEFDSDEEAPTC